MKPFPTDRIAKLLVPPAWRRRAREQLVAMQVKHVAGPKRIRLSKNEAAVTCVVKNGEFYLESFLRHYLQMGFKHVFLLDNGSTDRTASIAKEHANVSLSQSTLPIDRHQRLFKRHLAQQSVEGGWCVDADVDEFFDYPGSDEIPLGKFLAYLNRHQYTAVVTQLLDMFSAAALAELQDGKQEDLFALYEYYDLSAARSTPYRTSEVAAQYGPRNQVAHDGTALWWGGIRKTLWGNDCLLTKHSLFLPASGLDPFPHVHFVDNASLADVSCVMRHYKLTSNALAMALQNRTEFLTHSQTYANCVEFLTNSSAHSVKQETAKQFRGTDALVAEGFLFASAGYREYVGSSSGAAT